MANTRIKRLCLSKNRIGDEGLDHLGAMLSRNTTLTTLDLRFNNLTPEVWSTDFISLIFLQCISFPFPQSLCACCVVHNREWAGSCRASSDRT